MHTMSEIADSGGLVVIQRTEDTRTKRSNFVLNLCILPKFNTFQNTRIMFSKGMVSKSKYWISEKNKGMSVSICLHFKGIFQSQYSLF